MERDDGEQCSRRRKVEDAVDKISTLPSSILHEIFSLVDIKQVVQTSVLSRRWRYVWTSHPYLNLEFRRMIPAAEGDAQFRNYTNFISRVLSLRDHSCGIIRSRISIYFDLTPEFLNEFITYLVEHNVEQLHIHAISCTDPPYVFPYCFSDCNSLIELDLEFNDSVLLPVVLAMPNLKKLRLKGFTFWHYDDSDSESYDNEADVYGYTMESEDPFAVPRDHCIINSIFSYCEKLECLILEKCDFYCLNVSLPLLKRLEIRLMSHYSPDVDVVVNLDTPLLSSFKLEGGASVVLSVKSELSCLEKVHLNLYHTSLCVFGDRVQKRVLVNIIDMLEKLGNASTIILAKETIQILALVSRKRFPPLFYGMKHLKILTSFKQVTLSPEEVAIICSSYRKIPNNSFT